MSTPVYNQRRKSMLDEILELTVGAPAAGGGFVAHAPDGRVVFVRHAISGERVQAIITEEAKSYLRADAVEVLEPSHLRVEPRCVHAGPGACGGCDWQHIELAGQREFKADRIKEQLQRLAGLSTEVSVQAVTGDDEGYQWRTRVGYGVDTDGRVGFRRHRSHEIELIDHCPLATASVNNLGIVHEQWPGVLDIDAFCSVDGNHKVIEINTGRNRIEAVPAIGADLVINNHVHIGKARVENSVLGRRFSVSAGVFWQVHPGAAATLGRAVLAGVGDITGERVLDLYCGAGLFSVLLARAVGPQGEVIGIERDRKACQDARHNTADLKNVSIVQAAVTAKTITGLGQPPETVVLDPSREGAGRQVISALCQLAPTLKRIVYVSCDPATFARDVRVAQDLNWSLEKLDAFDLFPMTEHVELVGVLRSTS
jgi:tRNA/tmRNA/rRNA uracil-C5-methylase (TrmA/RlmC/RlmD family)